MQVRVGSATMTVEIRQRRHGWWVQTNNPRCPVLGGIDEGVEGIDGRQEWVNGRYIRELVGIS
jgi:hypothetical protein